MKARQISENLNFERGKGSKESLDIGYQSGEDYVNKKMGDFGTEPHDFWIEWAYTMRQIYTWDDLLDILRDTVKKIPLRDQIEFYKQEVEEYIDSNSD